MTALNINTSAGNNSMQNSWRRPDPEASSFNRTLNAQSDVEANYPKTATSNFTSLVSPNGNLETKKFDTAALALTSSQSDPVVAERAAPEASAATGEGNVVEPDWHSRSPFTRGFPATPYVHNSWNRAPVFTPPAPWAPPVKSWSPSTPVGNAFNPNPVASPLPWSGVPNSAAHKPFVHSTEVAGTMVWEQGGNPNITPQTLGRHTNLLPHQATTANRLISGNGNPYDQNPTVHAGQLNSFMGNNWTNAARLQGEFLRAADTASFNHRADPTIREITYDGYKELNRNAGAGEGSLQSFLNIAGTNWWEGMPHSISPGELQARGLSFDRNGHFSVSQFTDIARRAHFFG